ncbi:hypothetical protein BG004_005476 [Podila humilis]|nr:hypothetical protein BG004_005476 [Podila humilis]
MCSKQTHLHKVQSAPSSPNLQMHSSATHPVPRCVLAQTFLDNINRSSSGSSGSESNGGSSSDEDRNSDMDEKLQQSPNRLQGRQQEYRHIQVAHHLQHQPHLHQQQPHRQQYQQAQIQYHHQQQQHQHGQHGMIQQRYHHRRDDSTDLSRNDTCTLDSSNSESAGSTEIAGSCLGSRASVAGTIVFTNCNDSAPSLLPVPGISSNKNHAQEKKRQSHSHYPHQAQQNQMHDPHLQHLQQQQQQQHIEHHFGTNQHLVLPQSSALSAPQKQQPQHSSSACLPSVPSNPSPRAGVFEHQPQQQQNHRSCHSYKHSFVHSHFPPLHDIALDMVDTTMKRVDHPTLDQMLTTLKATTAASSKTAENSAISMKTLMSRTNKNKVPPPLIIPSSVGAKAVEKHQQQQQQQQQQRKVSESRLRAWLYTSMYTIIIITIPRTRKQ